MHYSNSFYAHLPHGARSRIRHQVGVALGPNTTIFDRRNQDAEIERLASHYGVTQTVILRCLSPAPPQQVLFAA